MADSKKKAVAQVDDNVILVTQRGYDDMVAEVEERKLLRESIAREIDEARDLGDLSENASYHEAMERKELNENRIDELEDQISRARVVEVSTNDNVVTMGRKVEIQNIDTKQKRVVHIVGATEADPVKNKVSNKSPLGVALLNSKIGATIKVEAPTGVTSYKILKFAA